MEKCRYRQLASRLLYVMARVTAERLVRHLERSGYVYVTWNLPDIGSLEDSCLSSCRCRSAGRS